MILISIVSAFTTNAAGQELTASDAYVFNYATTFGYDFCGDPNLGERLRVVIRSLLEKCDDISEEEKTFLSEQFVKQETQYRIDVRDYEARVARDEHSSGAIVPRAWGDEFVCGDATYVKMSARTRALIHSYERGEVKEADVMDVYPPLCSTEK